MKIMSLNLFGVDHWDQRQPEIIAYIQQQQPEIILFQEVVFLPEVSPYNQVQVLNQTLGYPYEFSAVTRLQQGVDYPVYREGLAILSRNRVMMSDVVVLKQAPDDHLNRIIQLVDIDLDGKMLKLVNIHFAEFMEHGTREINAVLHLKETFGILRARREERLIMGDFNIPNLVEYADIWRKNYLDTTSTDYVSYPSTGRKIDYALLPKEYAFRDIYVSPDGLSDHRALTVMIEPAL